MKNNNWVNIYVFKKDIEAITEKSALIRVDFNKKVWIPLKCTKGYGVLYFSVNKEWEYTLVCGENQTKISGIELIKLMKEN